MAGKWIQAAKEKGQIREGKFGKATSSKIRAGIKKGGKAKKRAVLARTFRRMAAKRKRMHRKRGRG